MSTEDDELIMSTLSGAGTGAAAGSLFGPVGTGVGAVGGALIGGIGGIFSGNAKKKKEKGLAEARRQMQELQRRQYAQRMSDLENAMGYFKPVNNKLRDLYGQDAAVDYVPPKRMY
jgi:hypothetical protein